MAAISINLDELIREHRTSIRAYAYAVSLWKIYCDNERRKGNTPLSMKDYLKTLETTTEEDDSNPL